MNLPLSCIFKRIVRKKSHYRSKTLSKGTYRYSVWTNTGRLLHTETQARILNPPKTIENMWGSDVTEVEVTEDVISKINKRKTRDLDSELPIKSKDSTNTKENVDKEPKVYELSKLYKYLTEASWKELLENGTIFL